VEQEEAQQLVLGRGQGDPALAPVRLPRPGVEPEVGEAQLPLLARVGLPPPEADPDPGQQLVEGERLDQVVVGAGVEPDHPVGDGVAGRQQDHRQPVVGGPQAADHLQPAQPRHHHIEDHQIGRRVADRRQGRRPVAGERDLEPLEHQPPTQRRADLLVVVDHQDARRHGLLSLPDPVPSSRIPAAV